MHYCIFEPFGGNLSVFRAGKCVQHYGSRFGSDTAVLVKWIMILKPLTIVILLLA